MRKNFIAYLGLALIIGISVYNKYVDKISTTIYYVVFIFAAALIVLGNMGRVSKHFRGMPNN